MLLAIVLISINDHTSPIPMKARIISKKESPIRAAIGVKTVATDHQTTPKPNTSFPPILSAHMPPIIYITEQDAKCKDEESIREKEDK